MERALRGVLGAAVRLGKVLIQRDEQSPDKSAKLLYVKIPSVAPERLTRTRFLLLDPMLASGGSARAALKVLTAAPYDIPAASIVFVTLVSCPEGIRAVLKDFPDVTIVTGTIDEKLNEAKFIVPGLGDFGDRYFGTDH